MRIALSTLGLLLIALSLINCSESNTSFSTCEKGTTVSCVCSAGLSGLQKCTDNNSLGPCECAPANTDGGLADAHQEASVDSAAAPVLLDGRIDQGSAQLDLGSATKVDSRTCQANQCMIANRCYDIYDSNQRNACEECHPGESTTSWITLPDCSKTIAGNTAGFADGPTTQALFNRPRQVYNYYYGGNILFVSDTGNHRIRKILGSTVSTVAGSGVAGYADGPVATAKFNSPEGIVVYNDVGKEVIVVADRGNHCLRKIKDGQVTTLAGQCGKSGKIDGAAGAALFNDLSDIEMGSVDEYLIADTGNNLIRRYFNSAVSTYAGTGVAGSTDGATTSATFTNPSGLATESYKVLLVTEPDNLRIRRIANGQVTTVFAARWGFGDGDAANAGAIQISDVVMSYDGIIYFSDTGNNMIRELINQRVTTIAGSGGADFADGPNRHNSYNRPVGIHLRTYSDKMYIADTLNNRIRVIEF